MGSERYFKTRVSVLSGSGCALSDSFGTVTLTDNGNRVNIGVDLIGSGVYRIQSIYLNFDDTLFSNADNFRTTTGTGSANAGVVERGNALQADGYSTGKFDLRIPEPPARQPGLRPVQRFDQVVRLEPESLVL